MRAIQTDLLTPASMPVSQTERDHIYNGLDAAVTVELLEALLPQLDNLSSSVYQFELALQGPILDMNTHGILVDQEARAEAIAAYTKESTRLEEQLNVLLREGIGTDLNWRSPDQLKKLLYGVMQIPEVKNRGKATVDRNALEKLAGNYMLAEPIINHILALRDIGKKIGVLKTAIDSDGRIRTSYNIAGTNTGRLSSSLSEFGVSGGNLQNVEEQLRRIFVADPGFKFAYIDLEQAESRAVGAILWNLFHDGTYLDACESGDLHTTVTKLTNPQLNWSGNSSIDKEIAERPFYRHHSLRHMNKVLGHGSNYRGQPFTMHQHTKMPVAIIKEFQAKYFTAFPKIPEWHMWVENTVLNEGHLVSLTGRRRWFFGRRTEDETIRGAIAFDPQGSVADLLNRGMLQVWRAGVCDLLMQVHDAILIQYPEDREDEIVPQVTRLIQQPLELRYDRTLLIPSEAKVGWNWASRVLWSSDDFKNGLCAKEAIGTVRTNPDGLTKYKGHDSRTRSRTPKTSLLDRQLY